MSGRRAQHPLRMRIEPSQDSMLERTLEIESRRQTSQPSFTQRLEHRANILVLVLDRLGRAVDPVRELSI